MEKIRRWSWHYLINRLPERPVRATTDSGTFTFSNKDQVIGRHLFVYREFDFQKMWQTMEWIEKLGLRNPQKTILFDIGANIGTVCIPLLQKGYFQKAFGFEPEPRAFSFLGKNITDNGLDRRVQILNKALSDTNTTLNLNVSAENFGDNAISSDSSGVEIECLPLDEWIRDSQVEAEKVGLVWMDVQGHEPKVIEGGKEFFQKGVPLVVEFWPAGLKRGGNEVSSFCKSLGSIFSEFVDLDDPENVRSTSELLDVAEKLHGEDFTDLLLFSR